MTLSRAADLAFHLLDRWGLTDWEVEFVVFPRGMRGWLAECDSYHRVIRLNVRHVRNDSPVQVGDSIRHEIAHALSSESPSPHGPEWRQAARRVGAWPRRRGMPGSRE